MIGYGPLGDTLKCAGITFDELMSKLNDNHLREKMNAGKHISMSTLDKICKVLNCNVEDVIRFYPYGERHPVKWVRGYEVDWGIVYDLLHKKKSNFCRASRAIGKKGSYFSNLSLSKIASKGTVKNLQKALPGIDISEYAKEIVRGVAPINDKEKFTDLDRNIEPNGQC